MRRELIRNMVTGEWREHGRKYNPETAPTETEWCKIYALDLTPWRTILPCGSEHGDWGVNPHTGEREEWYTLFT